MSRFLSSTDRVSVTVDGGDNVVWIRRKMDVATKSEVQDALASIEGLDQGQTRSVLLHLNRQNLVLVQYNVLSWEGPEFEGIPCTFAMIARWDPDDPLYDAVLARINELNTKPALVEAGKPVDPLSSTTVSSGNGKSASKVMPHA